MAQSTRSFGVVAAVGLGLTLARTGYAAPIKSPAARILSLDQEPGELVERVGRSADLPTCRKHLYTVYAMCDDLAVARWGIGPEGESRAIGNCNYAARHQKRWGSCPQPGMSTKHDPTQLTMQGGFFSEESDGNDNLQVDYPNLHRNAATYTDHLLHPLVGLECSGKYCDNLRATYATAIGTSRWTKYSSTRGGMSTSYVENVGYFSEEQTKQGPKLCTDGRVVTKIMCHGKYCDNLKMVCSMTKGTASWSNADFTVDSSDTRTTPWFSEEGSAKATCDPGFVLIGIQCSGKYCDNKRLTCARANYCFQGPGYMTGDCIV